MAFVEMCVKVAETGEHQAAGAVVIPGGNRARGTDVGDPPRGDGDVDQFALGQAGAGEADHFGFISMPWPLPTKAVVKALETSRSFL